jgi:hypothetical protein
MNTSIIPSTAPSKFEILELDPDLVWIADGRRKRPLDLKNEDDLQFIDSIRRLGNRLPIEVRSTPQAPKPYELITGRRRQAACKYLGRGVLAKIIELTDEQVAWYAITENLLRKQMNPVDRVKYTKLMLRELEKLFGPDPGNAVGGRARAAGASRRGRGGSQFAAESRLESFADGPEAGDRPAFSAAENAGADGEKGGNSATKSGGGPAFSATENAGQDGELAGEEATTSRSHSSILEETTGRSAGQTSVDRLLAESFNEEDLQVLGATDVSQKEMIQIAKLEPKVRAHTIGLLAMGKKPADAIAAAKAEAAAPPPPGPPRERDLTDEEWLRLQCASVRDQLEEPKYFDVEALYYRRTRENRAGFRSVMRDQAAKARGDGKRYFELVGHDIRTMYVEHPNNWFVCNLCLGQNLEKPECDHCRGNGYKIHYGSLPKRRP